MAGAKAICDQRCTREIRADCVKRIARRRDRLTGNPRFTIRVVPMGSTTELLSAMRRTVTVRRLWTGAKATNVNLIDDKVMLQRHGAGRGSERSDGCTGRKVWLLSATPFDAPIVFSLATAG